MDAQNRHAEAHGQASTRERIARLSTLARRGFAYWKGATLILLLTAGTALEIATHMPHVYRSECTIFAKPRIRTDDRDDTGLSLDQIARQGARLKDMLTTRARLENAIKTFRLYRETVESKTMLDAVEEMKPHVGFRSIEGGQFVISFDGNDPDTVQKVTQFLSESLVSEYAAGAVEDLERQADFLILEESRALHGLEESTRQLTVFLAAHPEFAVEAKQAATPFGPSPAAGIPLMPKMTKEEEAVVDPELAALYRERARLDGEVRSAGAARVGVPISASAKQLDEQIAQAQDQVEVAAKRVAETQADLASKSNLTEDHPDMRAARMAADAAARFLHETKVQLASLQQVKANGTAPSDRAAVPGEIADKLRQVDAQIAARRAQETKLASSRGDAASDRSDAIAKPTAAVTAIVELETEWQRLLRALNEAKSHHDDLKMRAEHAKLAVEAARAESNAQMEVVEAPYRPTHPTKGRRASVAMAGVTLACLLAIAYAGGRVALDDTLIDADDVERLGIVPLLGVVPQLEMRGQPERPPEATADARV